MPPQYRVGDTRRTLFATWRLERCDQREISFPFGSGFGCGQTVKISEGYKRTLETQFKSTLQSGLKLAGAIEFGASSSIEDSVTLGYSSPIHRNGAIPLRHANTALRTSYFLRRW